MICLRIHESRGAVWGPYHRDYSILGAIFGSLTLNPKPLTIV